MALKQFLNSVDEENESSLSTAKKSKKESSTYYFNIFSIPDKLFFLFR